MHILHLTRDFPLTHNKGNKGGISTAVGGLVQALQKHTWTCSVVSFDGWRPASKGPGPTPAPPTLCLGAPCLRLQDAFHDDLMQRFVAAQAPQLIHVHHDMLWPLGARLAESLSIPAIMTLHVAQGIQNQIRNFDGETLSSVAQDSAINEAPAILAPSQAVYDWLKSAYPTRAACVHLAPLGFVDSPELQRLAGVRPVHTNKEILYVGRFADIKGTDVLFEAIPKVLSVEKNAKFTLAGGMPLSPRYEKRWKKRWHKSAPAEALPSLEFMGWLNAEELERCYGEAAMLIAPSRYETFGFGALEGLVRALPIIVGDAGGLSSMVNHRVTGLKVTPGDSTALAEAILALLKEPVFAHALGQAGSKDVRARFSWDVVLSEHLSVYEGVCPSK